MYKITWNENGEPKRLEVRNLNTVRIVTATLRRQPWKYTEIEFSQKRPRRVREIVIALEA